jgi:hypothetical protein
MSSPTTAPKVTPVSTVVIVITTDYANDLVTDLDLKCLDANGQVLRYFDNFSRQMIGPTAPNCKAKLFWLDLNTDVGLTQMTATFVKLGTTKNPSPFSGGGTGTVKFPTKPAHIPKAPGLIGEKNMLPVSEKQQWKWSGALQLIGPDGTKTVMFDPEMEVDPDTNLLRRRVKHSIG